MSMSLPLACWPLRGQAALRALGWAFGRALGWPRGRTLGRAATSSVCVQILLAGLLALVALFALPGPARAQAPGLPPEVEAALARAGLPRDALVAFVADADGAGASRLAHRAGEPVNPASIMKLVTTYAALELLGPAYTWSTPVLVDGPIEDGVLRGNLILRGQGDPKLVVERLWLALRRLQALGVRRISGDIVMDRSAFEVPAQSPGEFDGEPLRPYNAQADALLLNFKSVVLSFSPDAQRQVARVAVEPPLAGVNWPQTVPLATGPCADWRAGLRLNLDDPANPRLAGSYASACGERQWPLAWAEPQRYAARMLEALWRDSGGRLDGQVREGSAPAGARVLMELTSPSLSELVRDVNKFSNNVMAQQIFLTLSLRERGTGSAEASRELLRRWWRNSISDTEPPVLDNGSGLSRSSRASAQAIGRLLQVAFVSPVMPELMASLPLAGVDGTLRRARTGAAAHLKTGSLANVTGVAGYVLGPQGRRLVLVAIINHPRAHEGRAAIEALVDWAARSR